MKQTIFETRQRADELLKNAIAIWRQSDQSDFLEGIENDPVFSLLISVLAYQANELDSDIERFRDDVLDEFANLLTPYEVGRAIPATAFINVGLSEDTPEKELNEETYFTLGETGHKFMPLLHSRVFNMSVRSFTRIDGRRWKVTIEFPYSVTDLSGWTFSINDVSFEDLSVTVMGEPLPLVKPWEYSEIPLNSCFSLDAMLYNRSQVYNASTECLDLFARQNVRVYSVKQHNPEKFIPVETDKIDVVFEFMGIDENVTFTRKNLSLNSVLLVNAQQQTVTLTSQNPIARVAGSNETDMYVEGNQQFMHLVRPAEFQIYKEVEIDVRRVAADRFNQGSLVKLLNSLINKFHSDFYAFQNISGLTGDTTITRLEEILSKLMQAAQGDNSQFVPGTYVMIKSQAALHNPSFSLDLNYLTTDGAVVNAFLNQDSRFDAPAGFDNTVTRQLAIPVPGSNEVRNDSVSRSMVRYYLMTNNRIVTPADIKIFCYNELMVRFGVAREMVRDISIQRRLQEDIHRCGYEILVNIVLTGSAFVKRSLADKIPETQILMQKMIEVRSANIYPIVVSINIEDTK